ncbi:MAG TPA: PQQ-dependent sugar dehydrogenase [Nitrososphaeraceae archaeon]|nr:PQQ-dependent sugar dehydrogenase [Nitrososphaeraceae archaeon]
MILTFVPIVVYANTGPTINDSNLKVQVVFRGIKFPSSMAFLGPNDILVLEKNNGTIQRIINGKILSHPLLHVNVANDGERGMLGIAISKNQTRTANISTYVFLYYTQAVESKSTTTAAPDQTITSVVRNTATPTNITSPTTTTITKTTTTTTTTKTTTTITKTTHNRLYRYELVKNQLVNPKLLLDLPALPGPAHNGGKVLVGPNGNLYVVIGDVTGHRTQAENVPNGGPPDGTGGILRITQDGQPVPNSPLGGAYPQNLYYAYGIRNSFGMDFDAKTEKLWNTENGPNYGDEINLVEPGFNSGWIKVQGIQVPEDGNPGAIILNPPNLENFGGKGKYRTPEFIWNMTVTQVDHAVAPTALKFLNSNKFGKQYENDMFVGDFKNGNLYHFKLDQKRTGLLLNGTLANKIADSRSELQRGGILFGQGFGGITDLQVGPDGYLYVLSLSAGGGNCQGSNRSQCVPYASSVGGTIFRIVPTGK